MISDLYVSVATLAAAYDAAALMLLPTYNKTKTTSKSDAQVCDGPQPL
jgi:hypothetical protein